MSVCPSVWLTVVSVPLLFVSGRASASTSSSNRAAMRDVAPEKFVAAVEEHGAQIVGISALMTTTMPAMKRTIDALQKARLRERVKVMVGGAPVTQAYCDEIGADGYAKDSTLAVVRAKALMGVPAGAA